MAYNNPGAFFIGGVYQQDRPFLYQVIKAAREHGYTRFVEPCSGMLAGSIMAKMAGYDTAEASDVTLIPSVVGNAVAGREIDELVIRINGEEPTDTVDFLYKAMSATLAENSWNENGLAQYDDFVDKGEHQREKIKEQLDGLKEKVPENFEFTPMDMFEHIRRVKDDPTAILWLWPPTYAGGYETFYKTMDKYVTWDTEPPFEMFDPADGYRNLVEELKDAKCLMILGEEGTRAVGDAIFARNAGRPGLKTYIVTNRPEEVTQWVPKTIARNAPKEDEDTPFELFDQDVTADSKIEVVKLKDAQTRRYKKLLTKRFRPSNSADGYALLVDGKLAGIFGYMDLGILLSGLPYAMIGFALAVPGHKLGRLLHMVAIQREQVERHYEPLTMANLVGIRTNIITNKPRSMELRGVMELVGEKKDGSGRNSLVYQSDFGELTLDEVKRRFLGLDQKQQRARGRRGKGRATGRNSSSDS